MSSDGYFDEFPSFDAAALAELDEIEADQFNDAGPSNQQTTKASTSNHKSTPLLAAGSFDDLTLDLDEAALAQIDGFVEDAYAGRPPPVARPSRPIGGTTSMRQQTLFGEIVPDKPDSRATMQRSNSMVTGSRKTKKWDQTAFAKSGTRQAKGKGQATRDYDLDEDEEDEEPEFQQFPAPFVSLGPPPPMKLQPDLLSAKHYIYPINKPKRDYQYNIIKHSLFENTLVALPTGLGKTFIAGVVMLNYHRWFPEGKVVFVAPTKPLVAQQIRACHDICGIAAEVSIEMTGDVNKSTRGKYWREKQVFFMTPQTFNNDLMTENCDAKDVVLIVIDEAHRATGNYAYNQVVRYMMAKNPHFRLLALTATPGNKPEAVQKLIDGLHLSHIEIRTDESLDLRPYLFEKRIEQHVIGLNDEIIKVHDMLAEIMERLMKPFRSLPRGFRATETASSLHHFRAQMIGQELRQAGIRYNYGNLANLGCLARAMMYLLIGSVGVCYTYLKDLVSEKPTSSPDKKGKGNYNSMDALVNDPKFKAMMQEFERMDAIGFPTHPKVEKLKEILIQHFGAEISDSDDEGGERRQSRVMVFSSYRSVVDEIVEELDKEKPLIRAARFIGQGTDKLGKKGLGQKQQLELIQQFQNGQFNVLVATCIGEEGLDIGEIDLIVCYDSDKSPTRLLQRFGRTGRKRAGIVHVLVAEGREEKNLDRAKDAQDLIITSIQKGVGIELYGDVERLIPAHIKPQCVEKVMEIQKYEPPVIKTRSPKKNGTAGSKRKRNDDVARNIPMGASSGFVSVRDLIVKNSKKAKKKVPEPKEFDEAGKDDDTDEELTSGRVLPLSRRTQSEASSSTSKKKGKGKEKQPVLRKSATMGATKATKSRKKKQDEPTGSQFLKQGVDDEDDMDIEQGVVVPPPDSPPKPRPKPVPASKRKPSPSPSPPPVREEKEDSVLEISDSEREHVLEPEMDQYEDDMDMEHEIVVPQYSPPPYSPPKSRPKPLPALKRKPSPSPSPAPYEKEDSVLEVSDSDRERMSEPELYPPPPSPKRRKLSPVFELPASPSPRRPSKTHTTPTKDEDMGWLVGDDDDDDFLKLPDSSPAARKRDPVLERMQIGDESIEISKPAPTTRVGLKVLRSPKRRKRSPSPVFDSQSEDELQIIPHPPKPSPFKFDYLGPPSSPAFGSMLPPPVPSGRRVSVPSPVISTPEASQPIRRLTKKRRIVVEEEPDTPSFEMPPPSQIRNQRLQSSPPPRAMSKATKEPTSKKPKRAKLSLLDRNTKWIFEGEAEHSGDDVSSGESNSEEDVENESDREFVKSSPLTQEVNPSYDQSLVYRQSLFSQMPATARLPRFNKGPTKNKPFGRIDVAGGARNRRFLPSSSPPPPDEDLDSYELDSFVVNDDDDVEYEYE